ncbi:MAG: hypothetical protein KZQ73_07960 [Candidatus Thiodiazotropha sp. (ex Semelilucina semeliformis)]|nr:hypothetical protein [Candidatus Thiodiazotropha sp. (ex Semelilucina semeliformis)]
MKKNDPTNFDSELQQALCILANNLESGEPLTTADISRILREEWGVNLHWRTIGAAFDKNKTLVSRRKRQHKWHYSILAKGQDSLNVSDSKVTVIDPKNAIQHVKSLHDQLVELKGNIYICDPYLDSVTLEHLDSCAEGTNLSLLTHNIQDTGRLRQLLSAFPNTKKRIEVRKTKKAVIHDRYIVDKKGMLILGTSLNGFGKKQCFIISAGQDIRTTMLDSFKALWETAEVWPGA